MDYKIRRQAIKLIRKQVVEDAISRFSPQYSLSVIGESLRVSRQYIFKILKDMEREESKDSNTDAPQTP